MKMLLYFLSISLSELPCKIVGVNDLGCLVGLSKLFRWKILEVLGSPGKELIEAFMKEATEGGVTELRPWEASDSVLFVS